jgi:hypothetical protein
MVSFVMQCSIFIVILRVIRPSFIRLNVAAPLECISQRKRKIVVQKEKKGFAVMDIKNNGTGVVLTTLHCLHNLRVGPMEENQL